MARRKASQAPPPEPTPPTGPYRNPGSRHFIGVVAGEDDAPDAARLRNSAGSLRPLATIDTLLGQAERQAAPVAQSTFEAALHELRVLEMAADAGRRALAAFADARGLVGPPAGDDDPDAPDAEAIRAAVEDESRAAIAEKDARIAELESELDELTRPDPASTSTTTNPPSNPPLFP